MSTQARAHARGVALIAVLWLVAAMSLVISGVVQSVRSEMRTIGSYRQTVLANAAGDAAILMALQYLMAASRNQRTASRSYRCSSRVKATPCGFNPSTA